MTISMYQASVLPLIRTLSNLIGILQKGEAYSQAKNVDPAVLLNSRLYPDMFPLVRQVQIASDIARRGVAKLAGVDAPPVEDSETTFSELLNRLNEAIAYLKTFTPEQIDDSEEKEVTVPVGGGNTITMAGLPFLLAFVMPNVYFHVTTAYDILRHSGVEVGKRDFLGNP